MTSRLCTVEDVESRLGATNSFSSDTVPTRAQVVSWIKQHSDHIIGITGSYYGEHEVEEKILDYNGEEEFFISPAPIIELGSLEKKVDGEFETIDEDKYYLYKDEGFVVFKKSFFNRSYKRRNLKVKDLVFGSGDVPGHIESLVARLTVISVLESVLNSDVYEGMAGLDVKLGEVRVFQPSDYGSRNYQTLRNTVERELRELRRFSSSGSVGRDFG